MSNGVLTETSVKALMLSSGVKKKLQESQWRLSLGRADCLLKNDDHGLRGIHPPVIPQLNVKRSSIYKGTSENGKFNHHPQLAKYGNKYFYAWSNGFIDEGAGGQRVIVSRSDNLRDWSEPVCVAGSWDEQDSLACSAAALYTDQMGLHLFVMSKKAAKATDRSWFGLSRAGPESQTIDLYSSSDGRAWSKTYTFGDRIHWIFEAPRLTSEGRLLCSCATNREGAGILRWPGDSIFQQPEFISVPEPKGALFPYGEASWYETDDGVIVVYWRDEGGSGYLYVNFSRDGGRTFSMPILSDIPDSMSRVYAGRLHDGRYYLCGNANPSLFDRSHLMLLLSDEGYRFDRAYIVHSDPTAQRSKGLLKMNGYQYPVCLAEEERLIVGCSVNKEDIECATFAIRDL